MNTEATRARKVLKLGPVLLLAGSTLLLTAACTTTEVPESNIFAPGQSRFGYGGTQTLPPGSSGSTRRPDGRKVPEITRDPNNTTVDVTPPDSTTPAKTEETGSTPGADTPSTTPASSDPPVEAAAPKPATPREDLPFGRPVVGNKGYVYSPYAPDSGQVDVRDIPAGTKVKCPYTQKVFRVP